MEEQVKTVPVPAVSVALRLTFWVVLCLLVWPMGGYSDADDTIHIFNVFEKGTSVNRIYAERKSKHGIELVQQDVKFNSYNLGMCQDSGENTAVDPGELDKEFQRWQLVSYNLPTAFEQDSLPGSDADPEQTRKDWLKNLWRQLGKPDPGRPGSQKSVLFLIDHDEEIIRFYSRTGGINPGGVLFAESEACGSETGEECLEIVKWGELEESREVQIIMLSFLWGKYEDNIDLLIKEMLKYSLEELSEEKRKQILSRIGDELEGSECT
jgi:hypothetical protein